MRRRIIIGAAAAAACALIGLSIYRQLPKRGTESPAVAVPVVVSTPRRGEVKRSLRYSGTLKPTAMVTITPKVPGRIERIGVREGDWVRQGQVVAAMEDDAVRLQVEQAAGAYSAAQAQYEKAKKGVRSEELENAEALVDQAEKDFDTAEESYQRLERLYKEGTISRSRYEEGERQYRSAQTQLENARRSLQMMQRGASNEELSMAESQMKAMEAQYELARLQLRNAEVVSPISGRVAKVHTDPGNMAAQSTPLITVVEEDPMLVAIPLPEKHYGELREKQADIEARLELNALPGRIFSGHLSAVSPTIDPTSRTFEVEVELGNPDGLLHAGMFARVELVLERVPDALLIPTAALLNRGGKQGVFVLSHASPRLAHFVEIRAGLTEGDVVQVLEGLSQDSEVVSEGNAFLEEGQLVEAKGSQ